MNNMHYVGLDVHKKIIAFCIKRIDGQIIEQGSISTNKKHWLPGQTNYRPLVL